MCCHRMHTCTDACHQLGKAQREDTMLSAVLDWLKALKKTDLKALLAKQASNEEGQQMLQN